MIPVLTRFELTQAEGQLLKDQALLDNARVDQTRYETLLEQNAVPEQQLATQKALVTQEEGVVKADQGAIDAAKLNLVYCHITAPFSGQVGLRLVDPGNIVHATDTTGMMVITQLQPISVIFTVAEDQLPAVLANAGGPARSCWSRHGTAPISARSPQATLATIDNRSTRPPARCGYAPISTTPTTSFSPTSSSTPACWCREKRGVTLVNNAAVQRTTNETYVCLVKPDQHRYRPP